MSICSTSLAIVFTDLFRPAVHELQEVLLVLSLPEVPSLPSALEHLTWIDRKTDRTNQDGQSNSAVIPNLNQYPSAYLLTPSLT